MNLIESEEELLSLMPPEIRNQARYVELNLTPDKSRTVFIEYRQKKNVNFSDLSSKRSIQCCGVPVRC